MNTKTTLIALSIFLFTCIVFIGPSHADSWYWNYKVIKVGIDINGPIMTITDGTTTVQKFLDPLKQNELLLVGISAYSIGSDDHVHYVSADNHFDAVLLAE